MKGEIQYFCIKLYLLVFVFDELHGKFSEDNEREDFLNMKVLYKTMTQVIV